MAEANFSLLDASGPASLPLSVKPMPFVDPAKGQETQYTLAGEKLDVEEKQRATTEANSDRDVMKNYMMQDDTNLHTPEGTSKALKDLQGKISVSAYMNLAKHADTVKTQDLKFKEMLNTSSEQELKSIQEQHEAFFPIVEGAESEYRTNVQGKGEVQAKSIFKESMNKAIQAASGMKLANGQPRFDPEHLKSFADSTPESAHDLMQGSKYYTALTNEKLKESQAKRQDVEAKILADGGKLWDEYQDPKSGEMWRVSKQNGQILRQNPETGSLEPKPALPLGLVKVGSKEATSALAGAPPDFEAEPPTPEELMQADKYIINGKMDQVGTGAQAAKKRLRVSNLAAQRAIDRNMSAADVNRLQMRAKAVQQEVGVLMKQYGVISAGEEAVMGNLNQLEKTLEGVPDSGSPLVNKYMQEFLLYSKGDPTITAKNSLVASTADELSKVLSASTGAAGPTDASRAQAVEMLGKYFTKGQFKALKDILGPEMERRTKANMDQVEKALGSVELPELKEDKKRPSDRKSDVPTKVTPKEQAARDSDSSVILQKEIEDERARYSAAKTPEEKARKWEDIKSIVKERKKGKDFKDIDDPSKAQMGDVYKGYIFKSGVTSNKGNWEKL